MTNYLTLHVINTLPLHGLNRDENGAPKSANIGGVDRGRVSSQALKRAMRMQYERTVPDQRTFRSVKGHVKVVVQAVTDILAQRGQTLDAAGIKDVTKRATSVLNSFTSSETKAAEKREEKRRADEARARKAAEELGELFEASEVAPVDDDGQELNGATKWLSQEEILTLATAIADGRDDEAIANLKEQGHRTGALAIAMFGRMFANAPDQNTFAATAVSHALTTHQILPVGDYFTAVNDLEENEAGADHIGLRSLVSGVYYSTRTIDRRQLQESWTGLGADGAMDRFAAMVEALIYAQPDGGRNGTGATPPPALVLAETQGYRFAYDFERPVPPGPDGGYLTPTLETLAEARSELLGFDPDLVGDAVVTGTKRTAVDIPGARVVDKNGLVDFVSSWVQEGQ